MRKIALIAFLAVLTGACSSSFRSDVTRFHQLPQPEGESVFVTSSDPAKVGSLEFAQYAGLLVPKLQSLGYRVVTDPSADLVVEMDYDVSERERRYQTYSAYSAYNHYPFFNPYSRFHHYGFFPYRHHSAFFGFGHAIYPNHTYTRTIYTTRMVMKIRRANGEMLFEGSAHSSTYRGGLPRVMPYLVGAMFTNFPGQSGTTEIVRLDRAEYGQS